MAGDDGLGCVTEAGARQAAVVAAARWTWRGYRDHAWGFDELKPISRRCGVNLKSRKAVTLNPMMVAHAAPAGGAYTRLPPGNNIELRLFISYASGVCVLV